MILPLIKVKRPGNFDIRSIFQIMSSRWEQVKMLGAMNKVYAAYYSRVIINMIRTGQPIYLAGNKIKIYPIKIDAIPNTTSWGATMQKHMKLQGVTKMKDLDTTVITPENSVFVTPLPGNYNLRFKIKVAGTRPIIWKFKLSKTNYLRALNEIKKNPQLLNNIPYHDAASRKINNILAKANNRAGK